MLEQKVSDALQTWGGVLRETRLEELLQLSLQNKSPCRRDRKTSHFSQSLPVLSGLEHGNALPRPVELGSAMLTSDKLLPDT